ncbi:M20 metallopeptidase family protein [Alteribacillus bidgolensis]|uniref:Amidohydrolase n=1 Tax=Alteribacillus bidgolensis TaxID=930129 RepID=A0A1G8CEJ1_9BACI|nr:amidohydrolase [Alteribacillus bidgolensis]SDH43300.1 amidohydrolase [Alteribacillus bidgolensis]
MNSGQMLHRKAQEMHSSLVKWRRYLHQLPELSFQEINTASFVESKLRKITGMKVLAGKQETGIKTGVAGILKKGEGPVVALRADMDALPIREENEAIYKSQHDGVMHACGHDAHTSILLGAAHLLADSDIPFSGTVKFLFQPAEEDTDQSGRTGAPYFIEHGLLDDVSMAFALHMDPEHEPGNIKLHAGPSMANVDTFKGIIQGTGGHGAYPHLGTDPIWMLSFVLQAIQGVAARKTSPLSPAVISVGEIKTGSSTNVIPEKVTLQGTMRSYDRDTRRHLVEELENAFSITHSMGGMYELDIERGEPALNNDVKAVSIYHSVIQEYFSSFHILNEPYGLGGEDFGHIAEKVPAAMLFLGAGFTEKENRGLHMPCFDIQEDILPVGVSLLAGAALHYINEAEE